MATPVMTKHAAVPNRPLPIPESLIQRLKDTPQNPRYHAEGSVYNHTQLVLDQYFQYAAKHPLTKSEKTIFYWAAVLHDLGKIEMTKYEWGRYHSKGHEKAGVSMARDILLEVEDVSSFERKAILDLVRWHFVPLRWGLRQVPMKDYMLLGTRVDMRLLGLFGAFDIRGRFCEDRGRVIQLSEQFIQEIVPRVHQAIGTFAELQHAYQRFDTRHKDALWSAYTNKEEILLQRLLKMKTQKAKRKLPQCVLTIGAPRTGKSQHLAQNYEPYQYFDSASIEGKPAAQLQTFQKKIFSSIDQYSNLAIDGTHIDINLRQQLAQHIREAGAQLHYLFFEKTWRQIEAQNRFSTQPIDEDLLRKAYKELHIPHPWESHSIQLL